MLSLCGFSVFPFTFFLFYVGLGSDYPLSLYIGGLCVTICSSSIGLYIYAFFISINGAVIWPQ